MSERDALLALRGLIDEPIAPRPAFAEELRARLLTELGSHRQPAISEDRTMEITTPGLQLVAPGAKARRLPSWRRIAEFAAVLVVVFGLIAVFASERADSPSNPDPTMDANLGIYPPSLATPDPGTVSDFEQDLGVLWKITDTDPDVQLVDVTTFMETTFFLIRNEVLSVDSTTGAINWRTSVPLGWGILADAQGIYVTTSTDADDIAASALLKLNYQTGELVWSAPVGLYPGRPLLSDGIIYVWNTANTLYAISAGSGIELWSKDYSHTPLSEQSVQNSVDATGRLPVAILDGENLVVGTSDARVGSIRIAGSENHDWNWSTQLDFKSQPGFEIAVAGDTVAAIAVTTVDMQFRGQLTVWDRTTGEELWQGDPVESYWSLITTGSAFVVSSAPQLALATPRSAAQIVMDGPDYAMVALAPRTGAEIWNLAGLVPVAANPEQSMIIASTSNAWTAAINAETGEILGSAYPSGFISSTLTADSSAVYGQRGDGVLVAVDIDAFKNGKLDGAPMTTPEAIASTEPDSALLWQTGPLENVEVVGQSAVVSNGVLVRVIQTGDFRGIEAYDTSDGSLLWRYATDGYDLVADDHAVYVTIGDYSNPAMTFSATPEPLIIGPSDASLIALDLRSGDELWKIDTETGLIEPVIRDGTLYALESDWIFNAAHGMSQEAFAFDTTDGSVIWSKTVGAPLEFGGWSNQHTVNPNRLVVGDSTIVAILGIGTMVGIDRDSGDVVWQHNGFQTINVTTDMRVSGSTLVAAVYGGATKGSWVSDFPNVTSRSAVIAYDIDDGTPLWGYDTGGMPSNLAVADGVAVVRAAPSAVPLTATPTLSEAGRTEFSYVILGIDVATGDYAWTYGAGTAPNEDDWQSVIQDPSLPTIYVLTSFPGTFSVIDPGTGQGAGSPLNFGKAIIGAPLSSDGRALIQLEDGTIAAAVLPRPQTLTIEEQFEAILPPTGNPLPEEVVWQVAQGTPWPRETLGFALDQMAVADGRVYRTSIVINNLETEDVENVLEAFDEDTGELLWQLTVNWPSTFRVDDSLAAGNGMVFVVVNTSEDPDGSMTTWDLLALDGATGDELWRQSFTNDDPANFDPTSDRGIDLLTYIDGVLYTANDNSVVKAFDAETGEQLWVSSAPENNMITMPEEPDEPVVNGSISEDDGSSPAGSQPSIVKHGDNLYVVTTSGRIAVLSASDGSTVGSADPGSSENTTEPVFSGDLMIVGNTESGLSIDGFFSVGRRGTLTAFDVTNNYSIAWQIEMGRSADNVLLVDGGLYVASGVPGDETKTTVQRIDPASGAMIWSHELPTRAALLAGTTGPAGSIAAQAYSEGVLYSLDPVTGSLLDTSENFPAIALEGGDHGWYIATLLDGALAAISPLQEWIAGGSGVTISESAAPTATPEATASPDAIAWTIDGFEQKVYAGDIVVTGSTLIRATVTDSGGRIAAFDTQSGEPLWSKSMRWTGGLVLGDGLIYLPVLTDSAETGSIVAIRPDTGDIAWEQALDGRPIKPTQLGDTLFVAADSGLMAALDTQTGEVQWANHAYTETLQGYAGPSIPFSVGVSPKYVTALYPTGYFVVFDAKTGGVLYQLADYNANTQYTVINNTLIVLASLPSSAASPSADIGPPMVLRGINLADGEIVWENTVVTRMDSAMIVTASGQGIHLQLLGEQIETSTGAYDVNGFLPGGAISPEPVTDFTLGVAFQIDPASGEVTYVSTNQRYPYQYTGPMMTNGSIAIDYSQPPVGIDQPLAATPKGDQLHLYLLLADGSIVAVKQEAIRPG